MLDRIRGLECERPEICASRAAWSFSFGYTRPAGTNQFALNFSRYAAVHIRLPWAKALLLVAPSRHQINGGFLRQVIGSASQPNLGRGLTSARCRAPARSPELSLGHVRFAPESGHQTQRSACLLSARKRHMQCG